MYIKVHERDRLTDFLLIVARDLLHGPRPDLKLILMSATLDAQVQAGKIGAVGVSNFTPAQTRALAAHLRATIAQALADLD